MIRFASSQIPATVLALVALLATSARPVAAQHQHDHGTPTTDVALSALTQKQIKEVEESVRALQSTQAARAAGFRPVLGWIPSMGTHWVSETRMANGFDMREPDHLMFSPVNGKQQLVGVAYAFTGAPDATMPDGFDGSSDTWHDHPELAPAGQTLHMLHVWFVRSPNGVFAGHNPLLPFWATGITPPSEATLKDAGVQSRLLDLSAALAATVEPMPLDRLLARVSTTDAVETVRRERRDIRALMPALEEAEKRGDRAAWNRTADSASAHWTRIRTTYLDAAPNPMARMLVARMLDQLLGSGSMSGH